jgi:CBS domain containing-hemolysin-like protein
MSDTSASRQPRANGAEEPSLPDLFRNWLRTALGGKSEDKLRETIEELIQESGDSGAPETAVAAHERTLLGNILRLRDLTAIDVMVPRADIVAVEVDTSLPEVQRLLAERAHSRMPVYRETLDEVLGMVHIKDVLAAGSSVPPKPLRDIVRDVLVVAPSMPVLDLLQEMRRSRTHMALVVDEFGGIDGLITIEDVVEEIVGEIEDEHDQAEAPLIEDRPDGSFEADARTPIEAFEARVGPVLAEEDRDDIDTLGGLVFSLAGRVPALGEVLQHPAGLAFEVIDADARRVKRVRVRRLVPAEPPRPDEAGQIASGK